MVHVGANQEKILRYLVALPLNSESTPIGGFVKKIVCCGAACGEVSTGVGRALACCLRRSREGGNPSSVCAAVTPAKLDSRLRGNDGSKANDNENDDQLD
jgi:hypothetical protein